MNITVKSQITALSNHEGEDLRLIIKATIPYRVEEQLRDYRIEHENQCLAEDLKNGMEAAIDEFLAEITDEGTIDELLRGSLADELVCDGKVVASEESAFGYQFKAHIDGDGDSIQRSFKDILRSAFAEPSWWVLKRAYDETEPVWHFYFEYFVMGTPTQS